MKNKLLYLSTTLSFSLLCFASLTALGQNTRTYKVNYEQDGFEGYVQFSATLDSYNKGGAGSPVIYGATSNNVSHVITSYKNGKYDEILARQGIKFPKYMIVNVANRAPDISARAFFYTSPQKTSIHSAINLTLFLPDGHIMPDFSSASVDYLREYYKQHNTYLWSLTGGIDQLNVEQVYISDFKNEVESAIRKYESDKKEAEQVKQNNPITQTEQKTQPYSTQPTNNLSSSTSSNRSTSYTTSSNNSQDNYNEQKRLEAQRKMQELKEQREEMQRKIDQMEENRVSLDNAQQQVFDNFDDAYHSDDPMAVTKSMTPLTNEFARQGNTLGVYTTVGLGTFTDIYRAAQQEKAADEARQREYEEQQRQAELERQREAAEEQRRREIQAEKKRMEAEVRRLKLLQRSTVLDAFTEFQLPIPLSTEKIESNRIFYFVIASPSDFEFSDYTSVYVSNVFEIKRYSDGTWPYQVNIENEIKELTSHAEILQGYYTDLNEAISTHDNFITQMNLCEGVDVNTITYKEIPNENEFQQNQNPTSNFDLGIPIQMKNTKPIEQKQMDTNKNNSGLGVQIKGFESAKE